MQNYKNAKLFVKTGESNNMTLTKHYKNQVRPHLSPTHPPTPPPTHPATHPPSRQPPRPPACARHTTPRHTPRDGRSVQVKYTCSLTQWRSLAWTWQSLNF